MGGKGGPDNWGTGKKKGKKGRGRGNEISSFLNASEF